MKPVRNDWIPMLLGAVWAAIPVLAAFSILWYCAQAAGAILTALKTEPALSAQITQALGQLKQGDYLLPWYFPAAGLLAGFAFRRLCTTGPRRIAAAIAAAVLILPLTAAALLLTQVNGIRVNALLQSVRPLLEGLL